MSCLRWESNWCAGCGCYLKCSFLDGVRSFCGDSCTSCIEQYACSFSKRVNTRPTLSPCNVFFLWTDFFIIFLVCISEHLPHENCQVSTPDLTQRAWRILYVSYVTSSFEYNDSPCLVLPLVSWKPSPSPWKASAWTKQRLYIQTSSFSKYRGECLPGFYMEGTYSPWRIVFHVSSGAFDHFNKAV